MAVTYKPCNTKAELLEIAAVNGIRADDGMTKIQIVAALDAHNATESAMQPDNERLMQGEQSGAGGAQASDGTNTTPDDEQHTQGAQDGADERDRSEYNMFVYVGPSLPNGQLKENAVFRGTFKDVSDYLSDVLEKHPQAKKLIVPLHKLGEYSAKAKKSGNIINKYYSDIVSTMRSHKEV